MKRKQDENNFILETVFVVAIILALVAFTVVRMLTGIVLSDERSTGDERAEVTIPCAQHERTTEQFVSGLLTSPPTYFTADDGDVFIQYDGSPPAGVFSSPASTSVHIGPAATPPEIDTSQALSQVSNASHESRVERDTYTKLLLDAGRHWFLSSNVGTISLTSCGLLSIERATQEALQPVPDTLQ